MGFNFAFIANAEVADELPAALRTALQAVGVRFVELAASSGVGQGDRVIDVDGVYAPFLESLRADVVLTRPDFVVYGHADRAGLVHLAESLVQQLQYTSTVDPTIEMPCRTPTEYAVRDLRSDQPQ